jgi:hypothetical protein
MTAKTQAPLPDGRIARFNSGAKKLLIEGRTYNVWDDLDGKLVLCSPDDLCGRCALCRLSGAPTGAAAHVSSYRELKR